MFSKEIDYLKLIYINLFIFLIIVFAYLLFLGVDLILPFVIALLLSFGIISIAGTFKRIGLNNFFAYLFSILVFIGFFVFIGWIINTNITELSNPENLKIYQEKFNNIITPILDYLGKFKINEAELKSKILKNIDFSTLFTSITSIVTSFVSNLGLIIVYVMFILLEYRFFKEKLELVSSNPIKKAKINSIMNKIKNDIRGYFLIKGFTSLITGFLTYFILLVYKVDFALFWAFLVFILNFIPTVGSIIGVFIVSVFVAIQFGFSLTFFSIFSILVGIQFLIGNIIEPKIMGSKLNLSPLVILLSLGFWGMIWGIVGMLLSVPIMVIINIILSRFESTKPISILLSEKGIIEDEEITITKTREKLYNLLKNKILK